MRFLSLVQYYVLHGKVKPWVSHGHIWDSYPMDSKYNIHGMLWAHTVTLYVFNFTQRYTELWHLYYRKVFPSKHSTKKKHKAAHGVPMDSIELGTIDPPQKIQRFHLSAV